MATNKQIEELTGKNINEPAVHVKHSELERENTSSRFRSTCPVCQEGILFVRRHSESYALLAQDNCILCGQRIIYDDIDAMMLMDFIQTLPE